MKKKVKGQSAIGNDRDRLLKAAPGLKGAVESAERGDEKKALEGIGGFLLGASFAPGSLGEAYQLFHAGRVAEALAQTERVEVPPDHPPDAARTFRGVLHAFRGDCLLALGREDEALEAFKRSCEEDADSVAAWQLASFALKRGAAELARLAQSYLAKRGAEAAMMARLHGVDLAALRSLANG
jgi:tetratricopeptide (TPR) repeat protein